jgi:hypothetical protein
MGPLLLRRQNDDKLRGVNSRGFPVRVLLRLVLVVGLLSAHVPMCKLALAQSHTAAQINATHEPTAGNTKCKKGCCPAETKRPFPDTPKHDPGTPGKPTCPDNCPCPLCTPSPVTVGEPACEFTHDFESSEPLTVPSRQLPGKVSHSPLDRPPRT